MAVTDEIFLGTAKYGKKFSSMCSALQNFFGLNAVSYININNKGQLINLHTHTEWMQHCMEQEYFMCDPCMVSPENMSSGFSVGETYEPSDYTDVMLKDSIEHFDLAHECCYVEKNVNEYHLFGFNAPKKHNKTLNKITSNYKILRNFIRKIQSDLREDQKFVSGVAVDFADIKGKLFHNQEGLVYNNQTNREDQLLLLKQAGMAAGIDSLVDLSLTNQEKRCLRLYAEGKTAKQVASFLGIMPRTVESYLDTIKSKLACSYKRELLECATVLESIGEL